MKNQKKGVQDRHQIAENLRQLSRMYVVSQKYRIKYGNFMGFVKDTESEFGGKFQYYDNPELKNKIGSSWANFQTIEHDLTKQINAELAQHPWHAWLKNIKGVGPIIEASIIGELDGAIYGHIEEGEEKKTKSPLLGYGRKFESTADLWSYAGFSVKDGKAVKRKVGEKSTWNKYLKLTMYKFAVSQIMAKGTYRELYDQRKVYDAQLHPELKPIHIENRSRRYIIKKFLSDINHNLIGSPVSVL